MRKREQREALEQDGYRRGWDAAMRERPQTTWAAAAKACADVAAGLIEINEPRGVGDERFTAISPLGLVHLKLDPQAQSLTTDDVDLVARERRSATGQQRRADRLKRALADLHRAHGREKRGRRKVEKRLGAEIRERTAAQHARDIAERACRDFKESRNDRDKTIERLRTENEILSRTCGTLGDDLNAAAVARDEARASLVMRAEHFRGVEEMRLAHDEAIATLQREAARAIESEVALKLAAVRHLRKAIGDALEILAGSASMLKAGRAETILLAALNAVIDPDDGNPH